MIVSEAFRGRRYAVLGLARSGMATVEALLASGAEVTAWDRREGPREQLAGRATIADPLEIELAGFDGVVLSPGVPLNTHPIAARQSLPRHKVVGITGTPALAAASATGWRLSGTPGETTSPS